MFDILKGPILAIQEFYLLTGRALRNVGRKPRHGDDIKLQMDALGFGAIPIVVLTGAFSGAVMALQMGRALQQYGQTGRTGTVVSIILVRELGSMKVTEQIDAMRALGTDPIQKLVTPRMLAMAIMLPCLTVIDDFVGMIGGWLIGKLIYDLDFLQYWSQTWHALAWSDVVQGLLKPFIFSFVISLIGCFFGLRASGGTQGVGRATTQAMVMASVAVLVLDLFLGLIFVPYSGF